MTCYRVHFRGITDRVALVEQLTISEEQKVQLAGARVAGEAEDLKVELLAQYASQCETLEGVRASLRAITALPVDVVPAPRHMRPVEAGPDEGASAEPVAKNRRENGRIVIIESGADGLAALDSGD